MSRKKFKTGNVELPDDAFENGRVRISIMVPDKVLDAFKGEAKKRRTPYQTLINDVLRANAKKFVQGPDEFKAHVRDLENLVKKLSEHGLADIEIDEDEEKLA